MEEIYSEKGVLKKVRVEYPERTETNYTLQLYLSFLKDLGYDKDKLRETHNGIQLKIEHFGVSYEVLHIETSECGKIHTLTAKLLSHMRELQKFQSLVETGKISKYMQNI